jgi:transcriptional regulator GlxA family with amidase domain
MTTAGILIFDDVDLRTFTDAVTIFSVANGPSPFRVLTIAEFMVPVKCEGGIQLQPDATTRDHPSLDVLLIPGGSGRQWNWPTSRLSEWLEVVLAPKHKGVRRERHNSGLLRWIRKQSEQATLTIGTCTGAVLLAEAGLLNGRRAAAHPEISEWMQTRFPQIRVVSGASLVDEGRILTGAGWNAALLTSMHAVAKVSSAAVALSTAFRADPCGECLDPFGGAAGLVRSIKAANRRLQITQPINQVMESK